MKQPHRLTRVNLKTRKGTCAVCGRVELIIQTRRRRGREEVYPRCWEGYNATRRARAKQRRVEQPEWNRAVRMEPAEYKKLTGKQLNRCAICKKRTTLFLDHDHKTGKPRGLLCKHCNWGLGHFLDDTDLLQRAAAYLDKVL